MGTQFWELIITKHFDETLLECFRITKLAFQMLCNEIGPVLCFSHRKVTSFLMRIKGIVHFEIKIWYLSAYPKGIQDVGVFFSSVDPILMFLGQTVLVCQSYNGRYRSLSL